MHTIELIIFFKTVLFSLDWNVESHIIEKVAHQLFYLVT